MSRQYYNVNNYVAEAYLQKYFIEQKQSESEYDDLRQSIVDLLPDIKSLKEVHIRMMRHETNILLTKIALNSMGEIFQKLARLKYGDRLTIVAISINMHLSAGQINMWDKRILQKVGTALHFKLTVDDIFDRLKIVNMIDIITNVIDFCNDIDAEGDIVGRKWRRLLLRRRDSYRLLMTKLNKIIGQQCDNLHGNIIAERIYNPHFTMTQLAAVCHVDKSVISRHIRAFQNEVACYVTI